MQGFGVTKNFFEIIVFGAQIIQNFGVFFFTKPVILVATGLSVLGDEMVPFWGNREGWHGFLCRYDMKHSWRSRTLTMRDSVFV